MAYREPAICAVVILLSGTYLKKIIDIMYFASNLCVEAEREDINDDTH